MQKFADILLPISIKDTFTYCVPDEFSTIIELGHRVLVNVGKRKLYTGIVVNLRDEIPDFETKPILSLIDDIKFVNEKQLIFWKWIANYYCCNLGDVMNAAIPQNLIPTSKTEYFFIHGNDDEQILNNSEIKILDLLKNNNGLSIEKIISKIETKNAFNTLKSLENKNLISTDQQLQNKHKALFKNVIEFNVNTLNINSENIDKILNSRLSKQKEILQYLIDKSNEYDTFQIDVNVILKQFNTSKSCLKSLENKEIIKLKQIEISRLNISENSFKEEHRIIFNEKQNEAYKQISNSFQIHKPVMLHGVTSSGKTEIYIKLIENALQNNKEILYLVPEIVLSAQIIERLQKHFGEKIAVFHSKYSTNIRAEIYNSVLAGKIKIVLGARSAIFLPFNNLGLIIVDEEHELSYKQQNPAPRYNARDMSMVLAKIYNANVILGSATPSFESYYNAVKEKYSLVELNTRYGNITPPKITVLDIKDAYRRKIMLRHFHPILIEKIKESLANNKQIILFQNRRGYSPHIECKECGWVPYCKNCNVSLTLHKSNNALVCHYCGEKYDIVDTCSDCGSKQLTNKGFGTEQIEEETTKLFPTAKIARLDLDTATSRKRYEKIINDFENNQLDILIGTQMLSKGFDFANVNLVGILNSDNMLTFPDFRAYEKSYQTMTQVSGRAGRRDNNANVFIQTFNPQNIIIQNVITNDYKSVFYSQIQERQLFKYPPFWNFIIIRLKDQNQNKLYKAANIIVNELKTNLHERVKGPEEPLINKINNYFILNVHIRFEKQISSEKVKILVMEKVNGLVEMKDFSSVRIEIDIDPN